VRHCRVSHQEHGNNAEQTHGKQNSVTWAHHSPLRTKVQAARRSFRREQRGRK
jgi:hypothetical protein